MKTDAKQTKQEKPAEEIQNKKTVAAGAIIGGLLFGIFIGNIWRGREKGDITITESKETATKIDSKTATSSKTAEQSASMVKTIEKNKPKAETVKSTENSITLFSEQLAGNTVSIERAILSQDGWLVVREKIDGEFGRILGAIWLSKGTTNSAAIELLRGTETGKDYFVVIYSDDGDRKFSTETDLPIKSGEKYVSRLFTAK